MIARFSEMRVEIFLAYQDVSVHIVVSHLPQNSHREKVTT